MDGWPYEQRELEQAPPAAEMMRNFEKQLNLAEQLTNSLDEHMKPADEFPEPLPTPQPIKIQPYKKSNSQYRTLFDIIYSARFYCCPRRQESLLYYLNVFLSLCFLIFFFRYDNLSL